MYYSNCLLGFGLIGDFKRLRESYPESGLVGREVSETEATGESKVSVYDLQFMKPKLDLSVANPVTSLSNLAASVLGTGLDKSLQKSDWQRRPLSREQTLYAAIDALILVQIYVNQNSK